METSRIHFLHTFFAALATFFIIGIFRLIVDVAMVELFLSNDRSVMQPVMAFTVSSCITLLIIPCYLLLRKKYAETVTPSTNLGVRTGIIIQLAAPFIGLLVY